MNPLFWINWKLFIGDVLSLGNTQFSGLLSGSPHSFFLFVFTDPPPPSSDVFQYKSHMVRRVQILGTIVSVDHRPNRMTYTSNPLSYSRPLRLVVTHHPLCSQLMTDQGCCLVWTG